MSYKRPDVLFAAFEAVPFIKTGGLGDVGGTLPAALKRAGCDCRVILPKLACIPEEYKAQMKHETEFYMNLSWRNLYCGVESLKYKGVLYYFIDNEYYFGREAEYGYYDDGERIAFFSKAVCECIQYLDFEPEILHCNDWHTALVPVFLREFYMGVPKCASIKTVYTVHNLKFQGKFDQEMIGNVLGLDDNYTAKSQLIQDGAVNFMLGALNYSDALTTVSSTYAQEICTDFFGEGLNHVYNRRREDLYGILNGIDPKQYDPANDPLIYAPFDKDNLEGKTLNKLALQKELGLPERSDVPMIGVISRLTDQKGFDLVNYIMNEVMQLDVQVVVLGVGEEQYEESFKYFQSTYPDKMSANILFSNPLSHKIYASSDMILVPSLFEPCGLSQIIAMSYGTLPIVRETGGLKDTVTPYNKYTGEGTGFSFANYNAHELLFTIQEAVDLYYNDKEAWDGLVQNAFAADFSWKMSAREYKALYRKLIGEDKENEREAAPDVLLQGKVSGASSDAASKKKSAGKSTAKKAAVKKAAAKKTAVKKASAEKTAVSKEDAPAGGEKKSKAKGARASATKAAAKQEAAAAESVIAAAEATVDAPAADGAAAGVKTASDTPAQATAPADVHDAGEEA